jgi:hypothetical protein
MLLINRRLPGTECLDFVRQHLGPHSVAWYKALPTADHRVDLWRYLVLYVRGGALRSRPRSPTLAHARPRSPTPAHACPRSPTLALVVSCVPIATVPGIYLDIKTVLRAPLSQCFPRRHMGGCHDS